MDILPPGSRVAFYLRCSGTKQEYSTADQRTVLDEEAEEQKWEVVKVYVDEARSGAKFAERPDSRRLLQDAGKGEFGYVVVYDLSRLSRGGNLELWTAIRELADHKVRVYLHSRQLIVTNKNASQVCADANQAFEENVKRSKDATRSSLKNVVERKRDPGRRAPYGYDQIRRDIKTGTAIDRIRYLPDGSRAIMTLDGAKEIRKLESKMGLPADPSLETVLVPGEPDKVEAVRLIFTMALTLGLTAIANELNQRGIPGPNGGLWSSSTLYSLIGNPAYRGARGYGRVSKSRYHRIVKGKVVPYDDLEMGEVHRRRNPVEDQIVQEDAHEALVPPERWHAAQAARVGRRLWESGVRKAVNQRRVYLLAGRITCKRCGGRLHGQYKRAKGKPYISYNCGGSGRHGKSVCKSYSIPVDALEDFICASLSAYLTAPECLEALRVGLEEEFTRQAALCAPMDMNEQVRLKQEREDCVRQAKELVEAFKGQAASMALIKPQIDELAQRAAGIEARLQKAKPAPDKAAIQALVEAGMAFYGEQVIGPVRQVLEARKPEEENEDTDTTAVVKTADGESSCKGDGAASTEPAGRSCVAELKQLLIMLGVKLVYDPDTKKGTLEASPFAPCAAG